MHALCSARLTPLLAFLPLLGLSCGEASSSSPSAYSVQEPGSAAIETHAPEGLPESTGPKRARMVFANPVLDFGTVWDVEDLVGKFPFTNTGNKTLVIGEVKPSCGCTTTELDRMRFEPGESSSIDLVWKPKGFGSQAKTITVHSNSTGPGIEVLTIKANIKPYANFSENPVRLGVFEEGQGFRKVISLTCADPEFELLRVSSGNRYLTPTPLGRQPDGSEQIELVFAKETPWGQQNCSIQVELRGKLEGSNERITHSVLLSISGYVFGDLRVEPTLFAVGYVPLKGSFERSVQLKHAQGLPFKVTKAEVLNSKPPGMTVSIEPFSQGSKSGVTLKVSGEALDYEGMVRGMVRFETDIPGEKPRTVPVMGIVRK